MKIITNHVDASSAHPFIQAIENNLSDPTLRKVIVEKYKYNYTYGEIGQSIGKSKQWIDILTKKFLNGVIFACQEDCLLSALKVYRQFPKHVQKILKDALKKVISDLNFEHSEENEREVLDFIDRSILENGSVHIDRVIQHFEGKYLPLYIAYILVKNNAEIEDGVVKRMIKRVFKKDIILQILKKYPEGISVSGIVNEMQNMYIDGKVLERDVRSILTGQLMSGKVMNIGKSTYVLIDHIKNKLKSDKELQSVVTTISKWMEENKVCAITLQSLEKQFRKLVQKVGNKYMLKAILIVSGSFVKKGKSVIVYNTPECLEYPTVMIKDVVKYILEKSKSPIMIEEIAKIAEREYGKPIQSNTIPGIFKSIERDGYKVKRVEGGYILQKNTKELPKKVVDLIVKLANRLLMIFKKGFFIDVLQKAAENSIGQHIDKYEIKSVLEQNGFKVFGRTKMLIVAPKESKHNPLEAIYLENKNKPVGEIVKLAIEELGGDISFDRRSIDIRIRNYKMKHEFKKRESVSDKR